MYLHAYDGPPNGIFAWRSAGDWFFCHEFGGQFIADWKVTI